MFSVKTILALLLTIAVAIGAAAQTVKPKAESYDMTGTQAMDVMNAHEALLVAQINAQVSVELAKRAYEETTKRVHDANHWADDVAFNGRTKVWEKTTPPTATAPSEPPGSKHGPSSSHPPSR